MSEEYSGGMMSDSPKERGRTSKARVPRLSILKGTRSRRIPRTEIGEAMGGLAVGMVFVFPAITGLTLAFPKETIGIFIIIACLFWIFTQNYFFALVTMGIYVAVFLLGLLSMAIFASLIL